jgi:DNA-directed RNA polymerase specialized sigma24 family protein
MSEPKVKKPKPHYVDNQMFLEAMIAYRKSIREAEESGSEKPIIPNYIGECIMKIATKLSYSPNFINYSYRDDMILDGIENCIRYIDNFDAEKSSNPFSYFTQIIYYAFLRRIKKEKDQSEIKGALIREIPFDLFELQGHDEEGHFTNTYIEFMQAHGNTDKTAPKVKEKKKKKDLGPSLEEFIDE